MDLKDVVLSFLFLCPATIQLSGTHIPIPSGEVLPPAPQPKASGGLNTALGWNTGPGSTTQYFLNAGTGSGQVWEPN